MGIGDAYAEKDDREYRNYLRDTGQLPEQIAATPQPAPTGNGAVILPFAVKRAQQKARIAKGQGYPVLAEAYEAVSAALTSRAEMGLKKYGTYLRANNDRNPLVDLYQEILDAIMYSEQCYFEIFGDGTEYKKYEDAPIHLKVGAEKLDELYKLAAEIAPYIKKVA